ncbi:MAG TPA: tetratricopeptide repeat protein [Actinomycetota bacterium]|nr:tetratricopeptide repeat protein [Actinomycetota bacterium]
MTWAVLLAAAALSAVAAAGVLRPFLGGRAVPLEVPDPLEEERAALLRALREETERRAVAVLRALRAREGASWATQGGAAAAWGAPAAWRTLRGGPPQVTPRAPARPASRVAAAVLAAFVLVGGASVALSFALRARAPGEPITGAAVGGATDLAFFEQRVREHPDDVAARLDLADRYLQAGDVRSATAQYLVALELDPENPEALARLGFVLFRSGRPERGLEAVDRALRADPHYPEALYFRGLILLRGLDRPEEAARAFRAYLEAAPFGARREEVRDLLSEAEGRG